MKERETFELDIEVVKKARQNSYRKMLWMSTVVVVTSLVTFSILFWQWNNWRLHQQMVKTELHVDVYGMNRYVGNFDEHVKPWGATAEAPSYSLIQGQPVDVLPIGMPFSEQMAYLSKNETTRYLQNGRKLKLWYAPEQKEYAHVANDRLQLTAMPATKQIELAVSFNRTFTIDEWKKMEQNELTVAYWINDKRMADVEPIDERYAMGISLQDEGGEWLEDPLGHFVESAERLAELTRNKDLKDTVIEWQKNPVISGVILVGNPEELYKATNQPFVRATSIGSMIDYFEEEK